MISADDVTESSWMTFRGELNPHQKQDVLCALGDDTCAPQMFFPERETPLTLRYEQRCPLRHWRAGWSRDLVIWRSSYTRPWTLDLSERAPFCKQGQKSVNGEDLPQEKRTWGQHLSSKDGRSAAVSRTNPPTRLTLSRCACVWSVMGLADLWAAAALFHLPILGFSPSGRGRRGRGMCWESAAAYPRATWG